MLDRLLGEIAKWTRQTKDVLSCLVPKDPLTYSASISADTDVIAAVGGKRIKVLAYCLTTFSTTAETVHFKSNGTSGTRLWSIYLQAISSTISGANLASNRPIFVTGVGEKLTVDMVTGGQTVNVNISYIVE